MKKVVVACRPHVYVPPCCKSLLSTSTGDGGWALLVLDGAAGAAASLDGTDNPVRINIAIRNAAEDDVLAVEP